MGKRGPKAKATDSEIMALILQGKTNLDVATTLQVSEWKVSQVRQLIKKPPETPTTLESMKAVIKLEISQENTLSDLAKQIKDYTDNYESAVARGDEKSAYAWSQNRIKCVDMMARITGLYDKPMEKTDRDLTVKVEFV